jgi:hypothetical protein
VGLSIATIITPRGVIKSSAQAAKIAQASQIATARTMERFAHIIPEGGYTPLVNGQYGLLKYEGYKGGHLVRDHVGLQDNLLIDRWTNNQKLPSVSSFSDLNNAEKAIAEVLAQNKDEIKNWINSGSPGRGLNLTSKTPSETPVGRLFNPQTNTVSDVYNTKVSIKKAEELEEKYRIHTGFPQE